jgi:hypothetical protein
MANYLLRDRAGKAVGKNWADRFIKRTPELQTRWSRPYDRQRAACEDPALVQRWFELVQNMKSKYGIVDEDMYNFDESGLLMGKITPQLVVTGSEKPGRAKKLQPGDREWATLGGGTTLDYNRRESARVRVACRRLSSRMRDCLSRKYRGLIPRCILY